METVDQSRSSQSRLKRLALLFGLLAALVLVHFIQSRSQPRTPTPAPPPTTPQAKLKVGALAPDFELSKRDGTRIKLSSWSAKQPVALWFFSPT